MKNIILVCLLTLLGNTLFAEKDPTAIHVEVTGEGAPVLLIPGFTVPGESWNAVVSQLKDNYECHVVTLAGFGGKEPIEFPWLPKVNTALENYIATQDFKDLVIIGHSLGGTVATWLASRPISNIAKIILVDALPGTGALMFPDFNPDKLAYESPFNNQQLAMTDDAFAQMAGNMSTGMSLNITAQKQIKDWIMEADRKTYVYGYTDYLKMDVRSDLKNISIPVIILAADKPFGKELVQKTYSDQYSNLADYDLRIAENSAHFVMFDQPEWFMDQVQSTLASK